MDNTKRKASPLPPRYPLPPERTVEHALHERDRELGRHKLPPPAPGLRAKQEPSQRHRHGFFDAEVHNQLKDGGVEHELPRPVSVGCGRGRRGYAGRDLRKKRGGPFPGRAVGRGHEKACAVKKCSVDRRHLSHTLTRQNLLPKSRKFVF